MIEEILDRLERIDHKEYCGGFEFADSTTFVEIGRCFDERKQLSNYTRKLQQENNQLKKEIKKYINSNDFVYDELYKKRERIEKILGDKENE